MSYLVFARKYRPGTFEAVTGQEHVTRTLTNAIRRDKIAHAYLFTGPRGVGKTSIARIFAKSLNCRKGPTSEPCLECSNCKEIANGSSMAVLEIDGASHNSVDNVRELIENFRALPPPGFKYKIYIIDEVHMLSLAAFNALLKSLEEPPAHTVFILATTDAHKIPDTVLSRVQRFDLRALSPQDVIATLRDIAQRENLEVEPEALRMMARASEGSLRDAESLLDRVSAFCDGKITAADASRVLGAVEREVLLRLSRSVFARDSAAALSILDEAFASGVDAAFFLKEFALHWRDLFLARISGEGGLRKIGVGEAEAVELLRQVQTLSLPDIQDYVHIAREGADVALRSTFPKFALEAVVVRLATRIPVEEIRSLLREARSAEPRLVETGDQGISPRVVEKSVAEPLPPVTLESPAVAAVPAATEQRPSSSTGKKGTETEALDWSSFVSYVRNNGSRMLAEHLKRLSIKSFRGDLLEAVGPEFTINSLEEAETKKKVDQLLMAFCNSTFTAWRVILGKSSNIVESEPGSLKHREDSVRKLKGAEQVAAAAEHPSLKALQKHFPGSKIEAIKVKE